MVKIDEPAPCCGSVGVVEDEQLRSVVLPQVVLDHTAGVITAVQRYHCALAQMMAAEHTIREVVDNALTAGVSPGAVRGIINSFADAQNMPLLSASDVDPRLAGVDPDVVDVDSLLHDLAARRRDS